MKRMPMGGNFNMNNLMKQAQKMQQDMAKKQAELEEMVFTASSGGGAVTATVQHKQLTALEIRARSHRPGRRRDAVRSGDGCRQRSHEAVG